ncbi:alginate export family protein [Luteolibacter pohnpeiensis]|uniref:Alginate export family protein n=1 Tax=Luteolibacter pohnpeiensis TaxID=454153 RepID=A0A934VXT4_9BACT|nr:alginate export family protein [Luteolibacter pohnpeiensis]MBK1883819.1 alginate export family protein [Luteolibacter pohnpeiensis]
MKNQFAVLLFTSSFATAGSPDLLTTLPATAKEPSWITPTINIRARYEFADVDGFDASHALTIRERLGLKTRDWNGFSALVEGEFSQAAIDDYNGGAAGAKPFVLNNSVIGDPETNELNQAFLQYSGFESMVRLGRQRIIYDNAAFVGNVGWRQNEQTFDAFSISNKSITDLTLNYAFVDQVNRIFGSDAIGIARNVDSNLHLFNAAYTGFEGLQLGGYVYLMDFDQPSGWNNQTYGFSAAGNLLGFDLYGEFAYQQDAGPANSLNACYYHGTAGKKFGDQNVTIGLEHLDAGFQTPLATVHAFNGYADAFIGQRIAGTHGGISDIYLSHTLPLVAGLKWTNVAHAFGDDAISTDLGWEFDSVLVKKFDESFTAIAKFAHFESEGKLPTTTRFSVEMNYSF